jgi:hypothetical protein
VLNPPAASIPQLQASIKRHDPPVSDGCQVGVGTAIALQVASPAYIHDKNHPCGLGAAWVSGGTVLANATASTNRSTSANTQNFERWTGQPAR